MSCTSLDELDYVGAEVLGGRLRLDAVPGDAGEVARERPVAAVAGVAREPERGPADDPVLKIRALRLGLVVDREQDVVTAHGGERVLHAGPVELRARVGVEPAEAHVLAVAVLHPIGEDL